MNKMSLKNKASWIFLQFLSIAEAKDLRKTSLAHRNEITAAAFVKIGLECRQSAHRSELKKYQKLTGADLSSHKIYHLTFNTSRSDEIIEDDEVVAALDPTRFPNLNSLTLCQTNPAHLTEAFNESFKDERIRHLNLYMSVTTDAQFVKYLNRYPNIESLSIESIFRLTNTGLRIATTLPHLKHLCFRACNGDNFAYFGESLRLASEDFLYMARGCPKLETLDIKWCRRMNGATLRAIADLQPNLRAVFIDCANSPITGEDIKYVARRCPGLQTLEIYGNIPSKDIKEVVKLLPGLTSLTLSLCEISSEDFQYIFDHCKNLQHLDLDLSISSEDLAYAVETCKALHTIRTRRSMFPETFTGGGLKHLITKNFPK